MKKTSNPLKINPAETRSILSLFDKDDRYTDEALDLNVSIQRAIAPIVKDALQAGFPIREIIHLIHLAVTDTELDVILELFHFPPKLKE